MCSPVCADIDQCALFADKRSAAQLINSSAGNRQRVTAISQSDATQTNSTSATSSSSSLSLSPFRSHRHFILADFVLFPCHIFLLQPSFSEVKPVLMSISSRPQQSSPSVQPDSAQVPGRRLYQDIYYCYSQFTCHHLLELLLAP